MTIFDAFIFYWSFSLSESQGWLKKGGKRTNVPTQLSGLNYCHPALPFPACQPCLLALPALPASPTSFYSTLNPIIMSMVWPNSKIEVQVSTFDSLGT